MESMNPTERRVSRRGRDDGNSPPLYWCKGCSSWLEPSKYRASASRGTGREQLCRQCSNIQARNRKKYRKAVATGLFSPADLARLRVRLGMQPLPQ